MPTQNTRRLTMNIHELVETLDLNIFHLGNPDRVIRGVYCGDLLSWVMGKASAGQIWCTIMTNQNVAAVAALNDLTAVLLTEGVKPDEALLKKAKEQSITLLGTPMSTYSTAFFLHGLLSFPSTSPDASDDPPFVPPLPRSDPPFSHPLSTLDPPDPLPGSALVHP